MGQAADDTADTITAAKAETKGVVDVTEGKTPGVAPVDPFTAPGMHDVHDDSHHAEAGSEEHTEECDGACEVCGEHHEAAQGSGAKTSKLGALLQALTMGAMGGMPESREEKAERLLNDLSKGALRRVGQLTNVASTAMEDIGKVLSVLPADDREDIVRQLKTWLEKTESFLPQMRAEDIAKGKPTSAVIPDMDGKPTAAPTATT